MPRRTIASSRHRQARKKKTIWLGILFFLAISSTCTATMLLLDSPYTRISDVEVSGGDPTTSAKVKSAIEAAISGSFLGMIPRDSVFFLPENSLEKDLPREFPETDSVKISRLGFSAAQATITMRAPAEIVCLSQPLSTSSGCYYADKSGIIFESAPSSSSPPTDALLVYHISLPQGAMPEGVQFIDSDRLFGLSEFSSGLAQFGFAVNDVVLSTSTAGYVYGFDLRDISDGISNPGAAADGSSSVMRLVIDESKTFAESLREFSAFWDQHLQMTATDTADRALSSVDLRFGDNIIYEEAR